MHFIRCAMILLLWHFSFCVKVSATVESIMIPLIKNNIDYLQENNYEALEIYRVLEIIHARGCFLNDFGLFAVRMKVNKELNMDSFILPPEEIKASVRLAQRLYQESSYRVKKYVDAFDDFAKGIIIFEKTLRWNDIACFILKNQAEQCVDIENGFYSFAGNSYISHRYNLSLKNSSFVIYGFYLICLEKALCAYMGNLYNYLQSSPLYLQTLLPIYQLSFDKQERSALYDLLYCIRMCDIKDAILQISTIVKDDIQRIPLKKREVCARHLNSYCQKLASVKDCDPAYIAQSASYFVDRSMEETLNQIIEQDGPGCHGWLYFHLELINPNIQQEYETIMFDGESFHKNFCEQGHQKIIQMCGHIIKTLQPMMKKLPLNEQANKLIEQENREKIKKKVYPSGARRQQKSSSNNSTASFIHKRTIELQKKDPQEKQWDYNVFINQLGELVTHFNDESNFSKIGDIQQGVTGVVYEKSDCIGLYDNKRFGFDGNPIKLFVFGKQKNNDCAHLLSNMNYDYLRCGHKKITKQSDNNHAFTEILEKGYGFYGVINSEEELSYNEKNEIKEYGNFTHKVCIKIPGAITSINVVDADIHMNGQRGNFEFVLYLNKDDKAIIPLCVHRFYKPLSKNALRKLHNQSKNIQGHDIQMTDVLM